MLLNPSKFSDPKTACLLLWQEISFAAEKAKVTAKVSDNIKIKKARFICFYDTPTHEMYKLGYMLRRRQETPFADENEPEYELAFKFRSGAILESAAKYMTPVPPLKGETKLEEDVSLTREKLKSIFSHSGEVEIETTMPLQLRHLADIFPGVADLALPLTTNMEIVNNMKICEIRLIPGKLKFGGVSAKVVISLWYRGDTSVSVDSVTNKPIPWIAEVSFAYDITQTGFRAKSRRLALKEHSDLFAQILKDQLRAWISDGDSKTAKVYSGK